MPTASAISPQIQKEFAVALGAQDRRRELSGNFVPALLGKLPELAEDPAMLFSIAHHATLPHRALPNLELRLDQRHHPAGRAEHLGAAAPPPPPPPPTAPSQPSNGGCTSPPTARGGLSGSRTRASPSRKEMKET